MANNAFIQHPTVPVAKTAGKIYALAPHRGGCSASPVGTLMVLGKKARVPVALKAEAGRTSKRRTFDMVH